MLLLLTWLVSTSLQYNRSSPWSSAILQVTQPAFLRLQQLCSIEVDIARDHIFPELAQWRLGKWCASDSLVRDRAGACTHLEPLTAETYVLVEAGCRRHCKRLPGCCE